MLLKEGEQNEQLRPVPSPPQLPTIWFVVYLFIPVCILLSSLIIWEICKAMREGVTSKWNRVVTVGDAFLSFNVSSFFMSHPSLRWDMDSTHLAKS